MPALLAAAQLHAAQDSTRSMTSWMHVAALEACFAFYVQKHSSQALHTRASVCTPACRTPHNPGTQQRQVSA